MYKLGSYVAEVGWIPLDSPLPGTIGSLPVPTFGTIGSRVTRKVGFQAVGLMLDGQKLQVMKQIV
jgi:hypothetical protein